MKTASFVAFAACGSLLLSPALSFAPVSPSRSAQTQRFMFGGSGAGVEEEDPEKLKMLEQGAKQMGMSVEEYQLGIRARERMAEEMNSFRTSSGTDVVVERDGNSPPVHLTVTITDEGKAKGKKAVQDEIVAALKETNEASKKGREQAQKDMMMFIGEEIKKLNA